MTKPHNDVRRINPKERADLAGQLHGRINLKLRQGLHVKDAVIEFTLSAIVTMNALSFPKKLLTHRDSPFPSPHAKY